MEFTHKSVLLNECIVGLNINPNGIYVDCTIGGAGHSAEICKKIGEKGKLIGIDQDVDAIDASISRLAKFGSKVEIVRGNFKDCKNILNNLGVNEVDGFLLDLGVSSHQFDEASRGFSYNYDAWLDMRMDKSKKLTAYDVVNSYKESELKRIILTYGEERWAARIAKFIVDERINNKIETTFDLVSVIKKAIPKGAREKGGHPAKKTFQAIRIEVNEELAILENAIRDMVSLLKAGGRICIITFHSLEDRIVKETFKELNIGCTCPKDFPVCVCGKEATLKLVTRKPIIPSDEEISENNRSRSAKLRIGEKI